MLHTSRCFPGSRSEQAHSLHLHKHPLVAVSVDQVLTVPLSLPRFAVAWYPICRIPDSSLQAQFLTFHSLVPVPASATHLGAAIAAPQQQSSAGEAGADPLLMPLIGIKWVNAAKEGWLDATPLSLGPEQAPPGPDLRDLIQRLQVGLQQGGLWICSCWSELAAVLAVISKLPVRCWL